MIQLENQARHNSGNKSTNHNSNSLWKAKHSPQPLYFPAENPFQTRWRLFEALIMLFLEFWWHVPFVAIHVHYVWTSLFWIEDLSELEKMYSVLLSRCPNHGKNCQCRQTMNLSAHLQSHRGWNPLPEKACAHHCRVQDSYCSWLKIPKVTTMHIAPVKWSQHSSRCHTPYVALWTVMLLQGNSDSLHVSTLFMQS